jgi:hypothetical protein
VAEVAFRKFLFGPVEWYKPVVSITCLFGYNMWRLKIFVVPKLPMTNQEISVGDTGKYRYFKICIQIDNYKICFFLLRQ